jgi:hypothetical protein
MTPEPLSATNAKQMRDSGQPLVFVDAQSGSLGQFATKTAGRNQDSCR